MTTGGAAGGSTGDPVGTALIAVQADLTTLRAELQRLSDQVNENVQEQESRFNELANTLKTTVVGAATAVSAALMAAMAAGTAMAQEGITSQNKLQAQLGVTAAEAQHLGDIGREVFADNFGGSLDEAIQGVREVRHQIKGLADEDLKFATESAFSLQDAFGEELPKQAGAMNTLMRDFGLTVQEATDFLAAGFQKGLNASGDFLDTIGEYSTQFANGGASADQFFSLLQTGLQGGVLGTDKVADSFKEFRVRIQDGSKTTSDSLKMIGIDADKLAQMMASGQVTVAEAYQIVLDRLRETQDENVKMQAGVGLLGTQYEDLGQKSVDALSLTTTKMDDLRGATDKLATQYNDLPNMWASVWASLSASIPIIFKLSEVVFEPS